MPIKEQIKLCPHCGGRLLVEVSHNEILPIVVKVRVLKAKP